MYCAFVRVCVCVQVKNTKEDEVKIDVSEQVPLSTDDRIKVRAHV